MILYICPLKFGYDTILLNQRICQYISILIKCYNFLIFCMISEQSTVFPKQIKIDDYEPFNQHNVIRLMQTSNLLLGNGGRTSTTAIILAKSLHILQDENIMNFKGKNILQFGSGVGFLGIYLSCLGANVILTDLPPLKDMIQRNVNLNRDILKGQAEFVVLNWKKQKKVEEIVEKQQGKSTSSSDISNIKLAERIDWTLSCQCGSIQDVQFQLNWIGKEGMIIGFLQREGYSMDDFLNSRQLQQLLIQKSYQYERIEQYHPDYVDERVRIYKIYK